MPYNGSGLFTRNYNWVNDRNSAIPITASRVDADSNDFASGLSMAVTRDGQGPSGSLMRVIGAGATPISAALFDNVGSHLVLNKGGSGHWSNVFGANNGVFRWEVDVGDGTLEAGANTGSDFNITRFDDSGNQIDSPISINRSTGLVSITSLDVLGGISAPISANNIAASGTLSVGGASTFTGPIVCNAGDIGITLNGVAGNTWARYRSQGYGGHAWDFGSDNTGVFYITDDSVGVTRLTIDTSGNVSISNILYVNAGWGPIQTSVPAGQSCDIYTTVNGVRQWYFGTRSDGIFWIVDGSAAAERLGIDLSGNVSVYGAFYTNAISCSTLNTNGNAIYAGPLSVGGITCTTINAQGNQVWFGPVSAGAITCTTVNTQGNQLTCGTISCGYLTTNGNQLNAAAIYGSYLNSSGAIDAGGVITAGGHLACGANGVAYTFKGTNQFAFSWASPQVTVWVNNTNVGVIAWYSDERIKTNIAAPEGDALADIMRLKPISFDMPDRVEPENPAWHVRMGLSAQDVQRVMPDAVPEADVLSIQTLPVIARLVGAIQQLTARVQALEATR